MKVEVEGVTWLFPPMLRTRAARGFTKALEGLLAIVTALIFGSILLLPHERSLQIIYSSTAQSQGLIGTFLKAVLHRPLVVDYGDPSFVRDTGIVRRVEKVFERISISRSDLVVSVDPVIAEYVLQEYRKKAIFLPNGYDANLFRRNPPHERSPSAVRIITFVGKMDLSIYRLDILLNAFRFLIEDLPTARLRIVGNGPDIAYLKSLARQLHVNGSVEFLGFVPHGDVPRWLRQSDVCVHITNDMCTGIKVSEYMAAGRPVIIAAPWWNRYSQFLKNRVNCVMVPLVAEDLATAIADLLTNPRMAEDLATNGFVTVSPWTWETVARMKITLIEELIRRRELEPRHMKSQTSRWIGR
jgi:glycosyltransferase involved in cell wall biosynthesis